MSWRIANECAERRFGSAARKQIIMFLTDKASDDGSGIRYSKGTIQRHTELGESTVKRTIIDFLREGILIETGRRQCKNGYKVIYRIVLERVAALEPTAEPDIETGVTVDPKPSINHLRASAMRRRRLNILNLRRSWRPIPRTGSETGEPLFA
ncbi:MAG: hypothetical protein OXE85_07615 [Roseovarius sp.]|nr:hypothetical protein [Roseovarius sp.]